MIHLKGKTMARVDAQAIAQFLALAAIATLLPFLIHLQWATGPIVNAVLIIALFLIGVRSALVLCLVPSLMALAGGLLPAILAPVVPFIMIGNVIFVLTVDWLYHTIKSDFRGFWIGVGVGAGLKFLFLFSSITFIGKLPIKQELAMKVAQMMSWPQFATALAGGLIAWAVLKWLKRI
ncbi:iron hydrogenase [Patescibacteria group bacterium]